jgi:hypothetical protein
MCQWKASSTRASNSNMIHSKPHSHILVLRSLNLNKGKQSKGKFTQLKDLYFPKGCGSQEFDWEVKREVKKQISPFARTFSSRALSDRDIDLLPSAQTINQEIIADVNRQKRYNTGQYIPDPRGYYVHDTRGVYIHDNRFLISNIEQSNDEETHIYSRSFSRIN